jgi:hypothetical protein
MGAHDGTGGGHGRGPACTGDRPVSAPPTDARLAWIERTRVYRGIRERDVSIERPLAGLERLFADRQRALGDVIEAWNQLAPERVRGSASIAGLTQGTLTLSVTSSSASYELSRALRDGLERDLVARLPARIRRVKVRVVAEE